MSCPGAILAIPFGGLVLIALAIVWYTRSPRVIVVDDLDDILEGEDVE